MSEATLNGAIPSISVREMTKREREDLAKLIRQRERLAKTAATERSKQLMADFEQQADRIYHWDEDDVWSRVMDGLREVVAEAQKKIADRCRELGIPGPFAPTVNASLHQQRAAIGSERAKMRQVAKRRIEQIEASARTAIERKSLDMQEALLTGGLETDAARLFAEALPSAEELMPMLSMADLQQQIIAERSIKQGFGRLGYDD